MPHRCRIDMHLLRYVTGESKRMTFKLETGRGAMNNMDRQLVLQSYIYKPRADSTASAIVEHYIAAFTVRIFGTSSERDVEWYNLFITEDLHLILG